MKTTSKWTKKLAKNWKLIILPVWLILVLILTILAYHILYFSKIYPNTYIAGADVSGMTAKGAKDALIANFQEPENIQLTYEEQVFNIPNTTLKLTYDYNSSINKAFYHDRTGIILIDLKERLESLVKVTNLKLEVILEEDELNSVISDLAGQIEKEPIYPSFVLVDQLVSVSPGRQGLEIDKEALKQEILTNVSFYMNQPIKIPVIQRDPTLTEEQIKLAEKRAQTYLGSEIIFQNGDVNLKYTTAQIISLLNPKGGYYIDKTDELTQEVASQIDSQPVNPVFEFREGKVVEFRPAQNGHTLNKDQFKEKLIETLDIVGRGEEKNITVNIPVTVLEPDISTEEVNSLGIKELIGTGVSYFRGSASERIHNINLAADRLNGILVKPGEVLSFNSSLGDVSIYTGYKQAFIIQNGRTILGDGGGVCQVSTTLFRAALDAGLPIIERRAHSYRVSYYEQGFSPGLDATVYAPTADLKIKNDTPGHILIQTKTNLKSLTLTFEIYGTSDGRIATTTKPKILESTPAPEPLYQDDPTLPVGTIKQVDYAAAGAKVVFDYSVERNGEIIYKKQFSSNYKPWQAVFLRGTGPSI